MSSKSKLLAFLLVLTSNIAHDAYCSPQKLGTNDVPSVTPQLTDNEKELMKNPLFLILFREFLTQVSKDAQTQLENQDTSTSQFTLLKSLEDFQTVSSFEESQNEIKTTKLSKGAEEKSQGNLGNSSLDQAEHNIYISTTRNDLENTNEKVSLTKDDTLKTSTTDTYNSLNQKSTENLSKNISVNTEFSSTFQENVEQENSQVFTQQNGALNTIQETNKTKQISEDTNVTKDDGIIENESELTANYDSIKSFQEVFGQKITSTTTEQTIEDPNLTKDDGLIENESELSANFDSIKSYRKVFGQKIASTTIDRSKETSSENRGIDQTTEAITSVSANFQNRQDSSEECSTESNRITESSEHRIEHINQSTQSLEIDNRSDSSTIVNSEENDHSNESDEEVKKQTQAKKDVKYQFATRVDDNRHGNFQQREETRDGGKITGSYAYDDGNILRSVSYIADEKGFRIIKDEISPSIKALQAKNNEAKVLTYYNGHKVQYDITQSSEEEDED